MANDKSLNLPPEVAAKVKAAVTGGNPGCKIPEGVTRTEGGMAYYQHNGQTYSGYVSDMGGTPEKPLIGSVKAIDPFQVPPHLCGPKSGQTR